MSAASLPMSSPSRSKSVAMMTSSAFLARLRSDWMMPFSEGHLLDRRLHEGGQLLQLPLLELDAVERLRELDPHDVALEPDGDPVLAVAAEPYTGVEYDLLGRGLAHREDLRDAAGGDVLL